MTFLSEPPTRRELLRRSCGLMAPWLLGPAALTGAAAAAPAQPMAQVDIGTLERWHDLPSRHVPTRPIDVWVPPGFQRGQPYRVLCMHDGQMLFDARTTWNRQAWNAHVAVHGLMQAGPAGLGWPTIVLGIWNREGQRYAEYFPEKALALAPPHARDGYVKGEAQGRPLADAYLRFIVDDLLPRVEARWGPRPDGSGVLVAGASMGGLISLYALCEYPQVFSGAACLSTHWVSVAAGRSDQDKRQQDLSRAFLAYLQNHLPRAGVHRIWVDRGDDALDSLYEPGLRQFEALLRARGYGEQDGTARVFKGTGHNEADWSKRLAQALAFIGRAGQGAESA
ncbi:MAG: esterase [Betaproteobacteria bacterium]|nr:esterase [Betaproteobacteria bacterium]